MHTNGAVIKNIQSNQGIVNVDYALSIFAEDRETAVKRFKEFNMVANNDRCLENIPERKTTSDKEIRQLVLEQYNLELSSLHNEESRTYLSWGLRCAYCMPQIYNSSHVKRWTYQKKWRAMSFDGLLSTNKWSEFSSALYSNQQSYTNFNNFLNQQGVGEYLEYRTWIARPSQFN